MSMVAVRSSSMGNSNVPLFPSFLCNEVLWQLTRNQLQYKDKLDADILNRPILTPDLAPAMFDVLGGGLPQDQYEDLCILMANVFDRSGRDMQNAITSLCLDHNHGRDYGQALIQLLNRDETMLKKCARFLSAVLKRCSQEQKDFFYTSDALVLVDILIHEQQEPFCLRSLKLLLETNLIQDAAKRAEIEAVLTGH